MKIDRLIGILSILLQKDKVTSTELAQKFEVSKRTILRDIDTLNMAGIPIVSEQGQGGGISIMSGYRVDRTVLSSSDMQAILSGLQSLDSVSGTNRYKQLMDKLSAEESAAVSVDNHILIDLSNWDRSAFADKIGLIKRAMEQNNMISFRYFSPNGETNRTIEPYHIVYQWSGWYVWGYCTERKDYRMFKLTRMTELRDTGNKCPQRDVPEYSIDKLRHAKGEIEAAVRFDKSLKWRIIDEFGTDFLNYDDEGNILLTFTWSDVPAFYRYILSFGENAEILAPEEYRKGFTEILKNISSIYER